MANAELAQEIEAGREADVLMAERVMGWHSVWVRGYHIGHFIGGHYESQEACAADCNLPNLRPVHLWATSEGSTFGKGEANWSPSTEISAAWVVAEKMRLTVTPSWSPEGGDCWAAARCNWSCSGEVNAVGMTNHGRWTKAPTASLAICRAALKDVQHAHPARA